VPKNRSKNRVGSQIVGKSGDKRRIQVSRGVAASAATEQAWENRKTRGSPNRIKSKKNSYKAQRESGKEKVRRGGKK